jgi:autotransporter-associated beta strand protein
VNQNARLLHFALAFSLVFSSLVAFGQDSGGYWSSGKSGSWANSGNWDSGVIADGTNNSAYFGISLEPTISTNAVFTLDDARTIGTIIFTGTTGPDTWTLSPGSGGPLTLADDIDPYAIISVVQANQQVTVSTVIAGSDGLEKPDSGTLILSATNTYTGGTLISGGTLVVNGALTDPFTFTNLAGTLGGTGIITGPVVIFSGAMLVPGNSAIGTLTISNSLTLLPRSKTVMDINASTSAHAAVQGLSTVSYGGTLIVSNLAGSPTLGQSFPLFNGATATTGNFTNLTPQLTGGLRWRFNPATGILSAVSTASQPQIASVGETGTNAVLHIINGAPAVTNYIIVSTNLATSLASWTHIATNIFDISGSFLFTNPISPAIPQRFYTVLVPPTL